MAGRRFPLDKFPKLLKNPPPDVDIMLYDKKKREHHPGDNIVDKSNEGNMTLTKLAKIVIDGFNRVDTRISNLEKDVNSLKQDVKDINARLDYYGLQIEGIQKRLDYYGLQIEGIQKRLDYNGLQIEGIQKRLDYNNLKKLPIDNKKI